MDYWQHARLSAKKMGGRPEDYVPVHRFIDSGKLFYFHIRHRLLLHNLYGVELAMEVFGDHIENSDGAIVLVRDIAHAHCREDLDGRVPSLRDWLEGMDWPEREDRSSVDLDDPELERFMLRPYLRSGIEAALAITFSDFGLHLVETRFGRDRALTLARKLAPLPSIGRLLEAFRFRDRWQYSPRQGEMQWLSDDATRSPS